MKITVTQEHIDKVLANGEGYSCSSCPVALALKDNGFTQAYVGILEGRVAHIATYDEAGVRLTGTSRSAGRFASKFDKHTGPYQYPRKHPCPTPFNFMLSLKPDEVVTE